MRQLRLGYPSNWADVWRTVQPHLNIAPSYPTGWRMISAMRAIIMNNTEKIAILRIITSFDSLLASAGGPAGTGAASTGAATGAGLALGDSEGESTRTGTGTNSSRDSSSSANGRISLLHSWQTSQVHSWDSIANFFRTSVGQSRAPIAPSPGVGKKERRASMIVRMPQAGCQSSG